METIRDIVREMRERADAMQIHGTVLGVKRTVKEFADRIEAAHRRGLVSLKEVFEAHEPSFAERCVAAKMREALGVVVDACDTMLKMKRDPEFVEKWAVSVRSVAARALGACDESPIEEIIADMKEASHVGRD